MLAQNPTIITHNSPGRTPFADFWLLAMLDDNPASRASGMGCFTHISREPTGLDHSSRQSSAKTEGAKARRKEDRINRTNRILIIL